MARNRIVAVFSGGIDSVCTAARAAASGEIYGITFSYGQRAAPEVAAAERFAGILGFKEHRVVEIGFMKDIYENTNVLTDSGRDIPSEFDYSIVVPVRNAVFLSIASAWAYSVGAETILYGAHTGDNNYPDCRPEFAGKLEDALAEGEADGIRSGLRKRARITSPYAEGISKAELITDGYRILGDEIFCTWSCYAGESVQCGRCESCNNRRTAFAAAGISDRTEYSSGC